MVVIQYLVRQSVVERQSVWLQAEPEAVAVIRVDGLYAVHGQLESRRVQVTEVEGRRFGAEVNDALVTGNHPQVTLPVGHHVIAERQDGIVLHLCLVIEVYAGESFDAASPDAVTHGVLHQLVERPEVATPFVHPMYARVVLVLRMVQSDDTVLPSAYPQPSPTVHKQRPDGITVAQTGIAHHVAALLIQAEQSALPRTYI